MLEPKVFYSGDCAKKRCQLFIMHFNKAKKRVQMQNCIRTQLSGFTLQKRYQQVTIAPTRKRLVASRSVVSAFTSEQWRCGVTFCGKGGAAAWVRSDFFNKKSEQAIHSLLRRGAADRTWTGTVLLPRDFKSLVSADSTIPAWNVCYYIISKLQKQAFYFVIFI